MPILKNNSFFQIAMQKARDAFAAGEVPVGAVLVKDDVVISEAANKMQCSSNPLLHAEMLVLQQGLSVIGNMGIRSCDLYVTLEPCPMCSYAISLTKIRRLYYGAENFVFTNSKDHGYKPDCYGGFCEEESKLLIQNFFANLRSKGD